MEFPQLSKRETEVIHLLLKGKSNKLIALDMKVSERTVEFHLKNIYSKFQVNSRMELVLRLKDDPNGLGTENLVDSTVAKKENLGKNDGTLNLSNWVISLRDAVSRIGKELEMNVSSDSNTQNNSSPTTFYQAIRTCLHKYAEFNGRASRAEFWWFTLFIVICASAFTVMSETLGNVFQIAVLLPFLAVGSRRLRDSGKSAWWQLLLLVPIGGIVILGTWWALPSLDSLSEKMTPSA